jgi:hypothetical protein
MYTMRQPESIRAPVDYLSGDFDWMWGADRAACEGRLLDSRRMNWDLMAWGFTKTGTMRDDPPWVMKPAIHLCQEVSEVVALGGAVMIYDTPQRSGPLTDWHQDTLAEVAAFCRSRKELCFKTETVPQAAILHLSEHLYAENQPLYNSSKAAEAIEGALHALLETHRSTDILTEDAAIDRMPNYLLLVVPERTRPSAHIRTALKEYVEKGGTLLLTGASAVEDYPELVGANARDSPDTPPRVHGGDPVSGSVYLPVGRKAVPVAGPWQSVEPEEGTDVWSYCLAQQEPAKDATDRPAVTRRALGEGAVITAHGPLFRNYYIGHYPLLRDFIDDLVTRMDLPWAVEIDAPHRLELILRRRDGALLVNLINRGAGEALSPRRVVVEELPPVEHVTVRVRADERPASVTVFPEDRPASWHYEEGIATIKLERVDIHSVVRIV